MLGAGSAVLDALHLASVAFLLSRGQEVTLATYDARMADTAREMGISLIDLEDVA